MPGPRKLQFASSYEAQAKAKGIDIAARVDDSLKSFMDRGDAAFAGERVDDTGRTREDVIRGVRENILKSMRQTNADSVQSADRQRNEHRRYSETLARDVVSMGATVRDYNRNEREYNELVRREGEDTRNSFSKFFSFYPARKKSKLSTKRSLLAKHGRQAEGVKTKAEKWRTIEDDYIKKVYRKHYADYDALAKTWYELTREYTRQPQGQPAQPLIGQQGVQPAVRAGAGQMTLKAFLMSLPADRKSRLPGYNQVPSSTQDTGEIIMDRYINGVNEITIRDHIAEEYPGAVLADGMVTLPEGMEGMPGLQQPEEDVIQPQEPQIQINPAPQPEAGPVPEEQDRRAIPEDAAKSIVEYTGVYDELGLDRLLVNVTHDPDTAVTAASFTITDYKALDPDKPNVDTANHTKTHKKILMLTQANEGTGIKSRMKFTADLMGRMSKRQFTASDSDALTAVSYPQPREYYEEVQAEQANLESDERDINGGYLYSEQNAEILQARLKRNGQTVHGFYMNGQFVTDEDTATAPDGRVSGKEGMKWWGRRSWTKQEKAEKLRVAIRKSAFFQHVNARTIQFYTSYQADEDYTKDIDKVIAKGMETAVNGGNPMDPNTAVNNLMANPQSMDNIPAGLISYATALYIKERVAGNGMAVFNDPAHDPVIAHALDRHAKELSVTALILLTDDSDPGYWTLARKIVEINPATASRTSARLKYLPASGETMRMTLMEELANHQQTGSDFDWADPLAALEFPDAKVLMEELNSRRGKGNWFKRNLLNGNLLKQVFTAAEVGVHGLENASDASGFMGTGRFLDDTKEERADRMLWFAYSQTTSNFTNVASFMSIAGVGAGALSWGLTGGDPMEGATVMRDLSFDFFDVADMVGQVKNMIDGAKTLISYLYNKFRTKTPVELVEERKKEESSLQDLDGGVLKSILKFCDSVFAFVNAGRDIASVHVTAGGGPISAANSHWGELLATRGPLDLILTNLRRLVTIVDDIREIVVSSKRIGRIDSADADIETAIASFEDMRDSDTGIMFADEEAEMGQAAVENAQAQYFMSLTRMQSRKQRSAAGWNLGANVLGGLKDLASLIPESLGGSIIKAAASVLPKTAEFIGWMVGKLKYDRQNFNNNIAMMLGDASYADTPYFNEVLKRETGIVNKHYLVDIARIFTAIDTHAMLKNPNASAGEMSLAKKVVGTLYGNVNDKSVRTIKLKDMLAYAGVSGESDWRSLLRNSLMA